MVWNWERKRYGSMELGQKQFGDGGELSPCVPPSVAWPLPPPSNGLAPLSLVPPPHHSDQHGGWSNSSAHSFASCSCTCSGGMEYVTKLHSRTLTLTHHTCTCTLTNYNTCTYTKHTITQAHNNTPHQHTTITHPHPYTHIFTLTCLSSSAPLRSSHFPTMSWLTSPPS